MPIQRPAARFAMLGFLLLATGACVEDESGGSYASPSKWRARLEAPAGAELRVRLASRLSSPIAHEGDSWTGRLVEPLRLDGQVLIPAGASVHGDVAHLRRAKPGRPAAMTLAIRSVLLDGRDVSLHADAEWMGIEAKDGDGSAPLMSKGVDHSQAILAAGLLGAPPTAEAPSGRAGDVRLAPGEMMIFRIDPPSGER